MRKLMILAFMSVCSAVLAFAQDAANICRGTVVDQKGEPMVGAIVTAKGTNVSVPTDIDGRFSLEIPDNVKKLEITYMGYNVKSVKAIPELGIIKMSRKGLRAGMFGVGGTLGVYGLDLIDNERPDFDGSTNALIGLHAKYSTSKRIRFTLGADFGLFGKHVNSIDLGLDLNWTISLGKNFYYYPLIGIGYNHLHFKDDYDQNPSYDHYNDLEQNYNSFSFSVGHGFEKILSNRISLGLEMRTNITDDTQGFIFCGRLTYILK